MNLPRRSTRWAGALARYAREHTQLGTKLTHMVGIPMILASFPTAVVSPPVAGGLFVGGWALQYIGHYVFEKNSPAFYGDPYYHLVGPVWVAAEWAKLFGVPLPQTLEDALGAEAADHAKTANGEATGVVN